MAYWVSYATVHKTLAKNSSQATAEIVPVSAAKTIGIIATDDLSGIKKYRATIDGKWVLCEYEAKQDLLFYTFDSSISKANTIFQLKLQTIKIIHRC